MNELYEKWWGGEAEYDLAQDLEDYYEETERNIRIRRLLLGIFKKGKRK